MWHALIPVLLASSALAQHGPIPTNDPFVETLQVLGEAAEPVPPPARSSRRISAIEIRREVTAAGAEQRMEFVRVQDLVERLFRRTKLEMAESAIPPLKEALSTAQHGISRALLLTCLGHHHAVHGDPEEARTALEAALAIKPQWPLATANLATVYVQQGQCEEALALLHRQDLWFYIDLLPILHANRACAKACLRESMAAAEDLRSLGMEEKEIAALLAADPRLERFREDLHGHHEQHLARFIANLAQPDR